MGVIEREWKAFEAHMIEETRMPPSTVAHLQSTFYGGAKIALREMVLAIITADTIEDREARANALVDEVNKYFEERLNRMT